MTDDTPKRRRRIAIALYLLGLTCYAGASSGRLRRHSDDDHYVYLANCWLHGRLDLGGPPPHANDWAQLEVLTLRDGRVLRGQMMQGTSETFRTTRNTVETVPPDQIAARETKWYVSFPPLPGLLLLPFVAVWGLATNDVIFTVSLAALAPPLLFLLLGRLRRRGHSRRGEADDLWLTAAFSLGSVFYYASVLGQVWYTAHVVSVLMVLGYVHCALDARRPFWAGLFLVAGFLCRPEILFLAPLFVWELVRTHARAETPEEAALAAEGRAIDLLAPVGGRRRGYLLTPLALLPRLARRGWLRLRSTVNRLDRARALRTLVIFGLPIALLGGAAAAHNYARFGRLTEFGHSYLNVRWTPRIQRYGLFNYTFLGRNLACLLALTPRIVAGRPYVQYSWHGLAIWVTSPWILWVLWPRVKGALHRPLWLTTACVAIPDLLYQNSGWVQFGYRFALDYLVLLVCLIAVGDRPLGRWFKLAVVIAVVINLFGAITFGRMGWFSFDGYFPPGID